MPVEKETDKPTSAPTTARERRACDRVLGRPRVDTVVRAMGGGPVAMFSTDTPITKSVESVAEVAVGWQPGDQPSVGEGSELCRLMTRKALAQFSVRVFWGPFSLDLLKRRAPDPDYEVVKDEVYVQRTKDEESVLRLAVPCEVKGAHSEQMQELPLGVQVRLGGADDPEAKLQGEVAVWVTRQMVKHIPCENRPRIPDSLG